jgi:VanZ family protein
MFSGMPSNSRDLAASVDEANQRNAFHAPDQSTFMNRLIAQLRAYRVPLLAGLYVALAFASLLPGAAPTPRYGIDIGVHTLVYAAVTAITVFLTRRPFMSILAVFAFSTAMEVAQNFVPGRHGALDDLLANGIGVAIGFAAWLLILRLLTPLNDGKSRG